MIIRGASWCDLVKHADGRVELVSLIDTRVTCAQRWDVDAKHSLLYLRSAADGAGRVLAGGQGEDTAGTVRTVIEGAIGPDLGGTPFPFSVIVRGESDGWTVFIQRTGTSYDEVRVAGDGHVVSSEPRRMPATSQGFLYISNDGDPVFSDDGDDRIPGLWLPTPSEDGSVWVGQSHTAATIALFDATTNQITPLGTPGGQPPHIVESGGTYYVCSYVDGGAWLSTHRRPFTAATPPIEPPPVTPPPVNPPEERPLEFEQKHTALMEAVNARFPAPVKSEPLMRDWTQLLMEQFAFSFPGEGWGCKSTSRGGTQSFDVGARQAGGRLWGYDLALNGGRADAELDTSPGAMDLTGQAFISVTARNHLGSAPPVTPPTQPPVTPPPASRPFPSFRVPEDIFLHAYTTYIGGLYARDQIDEPGGWKVASRGATMWFVPIFYEQIIALISRKGNTLPTAEEWWRLADEGARAAIDFYRRTAPPE